MVLRLTLSMLFVIMACGPSSPRVATPAAPSPPGSEAPTSIATHCEDGSASACFDLASTLLSGHDHDDGRDRGVPVMERACELGHGRACFEVGEIRSKGELLPVDSGLSRAANLRACELGEPDGCSAALQNRPGQELLRPERVEELLSRAAALRRTQCQQSHARACAEYARQLRSGEGVARDEDASRRFFGIAASLYARRCDEDEGSACMALADVLAFRTELRDRDERRGRALERACGLRVARACGLLALEEGYGLVESPPASAMRLVRRQVDILEGECEWGSVEACHGIPRWHQSVLEPGEMERAQRREQGLLRERCLAGRTAACSMLSAALFAEDPPARDAAFQMLDRACSAGDAQACSRFAERLASGFGIATDYDRAAAYYQQGCDAHDPLACSRGRLLEAWLIQHTRLPGPRGQAALALAREILEPDTTPGRSSFAFPLYIESYDTECYPAPGQSDDLCHAERLVERPAALPRTLNNMLERYGENDRLTGERWLCDGVCCTAHYTTYADLTSRSHGQIELDRICVESEEVDARVGRIHFTLH